MTTPLTSRRIVFQGLGALGVAAALAACGGGDDPDADSPDPSSTPTDPETTSSAPTSSPTSQAPGGDVLATTTEIPVGGGIILTDVHIVITQPTAGTFVAFGSRCKHQGFDVTSVSGGTIKCSHHGSVYDAATGENTGGPAPTGLDEVAIKVEGTNILQA